MSNRVRPWLLHPALGGGSCHQRRNPALHSGQRLDPSDPSVGCRSGSSILPLLRRNIFGTNLETGADGACALSPLSILLLHWVVGLCQHWSLKIVTLISFVLV